jgi:guanylate kinase
VNYHFWSSERFAAEVAAGAFLEHAVVHGSHHYGTLRAEVEPFRSRGVGVVLDIDVQGAEQVRATVPDHTSVFLRTSSIDEYERRLRLRRSETEASIRTRMETARRELEFAPSYQYQVVNDDLATATAALRAIVAGSFERALNAG